MSSLPPVHNPGKPPRTSQPAPDMTPKIPQFIFHVGSAAIMANGFFGLTQFVVGDYIKPQYGGFFQYLTILGLLASGITMAISGLADMLPAITLIKGLKRMILLVALPVEIVISSIYWPLVLFAPTLMLPPSPSGNSTDTGTAEPSASAADALLRIPIWMDLSMHALPAVALIIDFFALERKYLPPISTYGSIIVAAAIGTSYSVWVEHCASINGTFPYPFLTVADFPQRVAIYIGATLGALGVFRGLNKLHK